jgi:hypothetical protein
MLFATSEMVLLLAIDLGSKKLASGTDCVL